MQHSKTQETPTFQAARKALQPVALGLAVVAFTAGFVPVKAQTPPPDSGWMADAVVDNANPVTDEKLGACQGIAVRDGRIYAYGDVHSAHPRVGVIREYHMDLNPTGREVWLRQADRPLILHPTGLTWDPHWGTLLGDTVNKKATIYRLDWERAWSDGHLGRAVLDVIHDDAAINGCRPTFVSISGRTLIATADYGDVHPEIRLYDPELLFKSRLERAWCRGPSRSLWPLESEPALGHHVRATDLCSKRHRRPRVASRCDRPGPCRRRWKGQFARARVKTLTFSPHDELEGYWPLDPERALFVTSRRTGNIVAGVARPVTPRLSPAGTN